MIEIASKICESTAAQYQHAAGRGAADWSAFMRMLDQTDRSYRN